MLDATRLFDLICTRRGWNDAFLKDLFNPHHKLLQNIDQLVARLHQAHDRNEVVTIAPDFDMDGISAGVLGFAGLAQLGFNVHLVTPDYNLGHDLGPKAIDRIAQQVPNTQVLLTCDNGINSLDGIARAKALGWFTMVTDHHVELEPGCNAHIAVNPCRITETYETKGICGAHVLYQVLIRYAEKFAPQQLENLKLLKLFAGLGTVSDVMPLIKENRSLVIDSLQIANLLIPKLNPQAATYPELVADRVNKTALVASLLEQRDDLDERFINVFRGFATMLAAFIQDGKLDSESEIDEGFYGFYFAPAMNAPRRISYPLVNCFNVFLGKDFTSSFNSALKVIEGNNYRKELVAEYLIRIDSEPQPFAPWVFFSDGPAGVLGLLAADLMNEYGHAVCVTNTPLDGNDYIAGSARAPIGFNVIDLAQSIPGAFAIGHQQACGIRVDRADQLPDLVAAFDQAHDQWLAQSDELLPSPDLILGSLPTCDAPLVEDPAFHQLIDMITNLKPFGNGFAEPFIKLVTDLDKANVQVIGQQSNHLRITLSNGVQLLWWKGAERFEQISKAADEGLLIEAKVSLQTNDFNSKRSLQAILKADVKVIDPSSQLLNPDTDTQLIEMV